MGTQYTHTVQQKKLRHTFSRCYECIDDWLRSIVEITKLRFPYDQIIWIVDGHAIFESKYRFLRQNTVCHIELAAVAMRHTIQWDIHFVGLLINEHHMTLRKCAASNIFAAYPNIMTLIH